MKKLGNSSNRPLVLLAVLMLFLSVTSMAQTRRALVIGLGEQQDMVWAKINGDKDVLYVKEMLSKSGYKDVVTLVNKQATKASIVTAFKKMAARCKKGDIVYVHFSGHGQLVTDVNGDEDDGWDESWIPYDAYFEYGKNDRGEKHLIDDEINALMTNIRNKIGSDGKLLAVVDACHSGDSLRGDDKEDDEEDDVAVRGVYEKFIIPCAINSKTTKKTERWLTLSACEDFQINQELKKPVVGKLTYALYLTSKSSNVNFKTVDSFMARYETRLPQTPQQTGDAGNQKLSDFIKTWHQ